MFSATGNGGAFEKRQLDMAQIPNRSTELKVQLFDPLLPG